MARRLIGLDIGTNAVTVIAAVKNTALSTCSALTKMMRSRSVQRWLEAVWPCTDVGSSPQYPSERCWSRVCRCTSCH